MEVLAPHVYKGLRGGGRPSRFQLLFAGCAARWSGVAGPQVTLLHVLFGSRRNGARPLYPFPVRLFLSPSPP